MLPHEAMERVPYRWYLVYKRYLEMESGNKPHRVVMQNKIKASKQVWGGLMQAARKKHGSQGN